jgi:hypothetical protein
MLNLTLIGVPISDYHEKPCRKGYSGAIINALVFNSTIIILSKERIILHLRKCQAIYSKSPI